MLKNLTAVILIAILPSLLWAQGQSKVKRVKKVTVIKQSDDMVIHDSSEYHRINKNFQITGRWGHTVVPIGDVGVNLGFFLNRNSLVQVELSRGESITNWQAIKAETLGINYKRFFGNSFYATLGTAYRHTSIGNSSVDEDEPISSTSGTYNFDKIAAESKALVATVSIGNQWQWENFTLGVDWIGLMSPYAKISEKVSEEEYHGHIGPFWAKASNTTLQLMRVSIGASF